MEIKDNQKDGRVDVVSLRPKAKSKETALVEDERSLITRATAGDSRAFRDLLLRYQRRVYGVAIGMLHNPEDAMDITQEAFIKVHRYLGRFKGDSSFFTWLYRITINLCIDQLRKTGKAQAVDYDDAMSYERSDATEPNLWAMDANPGKALDRKELRELIQRSLDCLSPIHRAVILMREVEGFDYKEMAEVMQCSIGTIMSRLFHARRRFQQALESLMKEKQTTAAA